MSNSLLTGTVFAIFDVVELGEIGHNGGMGEARDKVVGLLPARVDTGTKSVPVDDVLGGVESKKRKINWGKVIKYIANGIYLGILVPVIGLSLLRTIGGTIAQISSLNGEYGGEFDPAMGAEIHSENGRALIVVHEGYGEETNPMRFNNDQKYLQYRRVLEATKQRYLNSGDVIVNILDLTTWGDIDHVAQINVLYFATNSNSGIPSLSVVEDGVGYSQSYQALFDKLRQSGVNTVEMAGEFRSLCVGEVAQYFTSAGFELGWCDECAFPAVDDMNNPINYPTLEPLP